MKKRVSLVISGKVQGVYYRKSTQLEARRLNLTGFVQNTSDGKVYAEIEGPIEMVDMLVQWCHEGPILAEVRNVQIQEIKCQQSTVFEIMR